MLTLEDARYTLPVARREYELARRATNRATDEVMAAKIRLEQAKIDCSLADAKAVYNRAQAALEAAKEKQRQAHVKYDKLIRYVELRGSR